MSFPSSPTDNQISTVNGIKYQYSTSTNSWTKQPITISNTNPPIYTFGGGGVPEAGDDVTPWVMVRSTLTTALLTLVSKDSPLSPFSVMIKQSTDNGVSFPLIVGTITLFSGYTTTTNVSVGLNIGDLLRCDILSAGGARDWACQVQTT